MDFFLLIIGLIFLIAGFLTSLLAPKIGPNPIFGVRLGYTLSDKRVWDKVNRLTGVLFIAVGIITMVGSFLGIFDLISGLVFISVSAIAITIFSFYVSKKYADFYLTFTEEDRILEPVEIKPFYITHFEGIILVIPYIILYCILLILLQTGLHEIATKFDFNGEPIAYTKLSDFVLQYSFTTSVILMITLLFIWIASRYPIVLHSGLLKKRWGRDLLFKLVVIAFISVAYIFLLTLLDIVYYALYGSHLIPFTFLLVLIFVIGFSPLVFIIKRWSSRGLGKLDKSGQT